MKRLVLTATVVSLASVAASGAFAQSVEVRGSKRVDAETIRNYFGGTDPARATRDQGHAS